MPVQAQETTMLAARLHAMGAPFVLEQVPVPRLRAKDVRVEVKACGLVPNLKNVITNYHTRHPGLPQRHLPAMYGLDASGVVVEVGGEVHGIQPGDRVYVNPMLSCGGCPACRRGDKVNCRDVALQGYFGWGPGSLRLLQEYPTGGFAQYHVAPAENIVRLPASVSHEQAARFGYLGTPYAALCRIGFGPGDSVVVLGATGTLGVGAVMVALAMGARRVYGVGRNPALLQRLAALAPARVRAIHSDSEAAVDVVLQETEGLGADALVEALSPGVPAALLLDGMKAVRAGGSIVKIGGLAETLSIEPLFLMRRQLQVVGSNWFTTGQAQQLADMAGSGTLDLSSFVHLKFPLQQVNEAVSALETRGTGGWSNVLVVP
jgi:threonine dehydrogenase-like Zn-dependent dehydrogenase